MSTTLILHNPQRLSNIAPRSLTLFLFLVFFHLELLEEHAGVEEAVWNWRERISLMFVFERYQGQVGKGRGRQM